MVAKLFNLARFISEHLLTRDHQLAAWLRFIRWQIGSRLLKHPLIIPWVGPTKLIIERGMVGATGNLYCGLHEFDDMGFVLHFLRPDDLFLDIGANVGTYTVLAWRDWLKCDGVRADSDDTCPLVEQSPSEFAELQGGCFEHRAWCGKRISCFFC